MVTNSLDLGPTTIFLATGHHNAWSLPVATGTYRADAFWYDTIGATGQTTPLSAVPGDPLSTVKVMHNYPWILYVGTQTFGAGLNVHSDTQQFYVDHGRHN